MADLPFSFVVMGIPRSLQAKRQSRWKDKVRSVAAESWGDDPPLEDEVSVVIIYFYRDGSVDVDNMVKPILDAMTTLVYVDDGQISQIIARQIELATGLDISGATPDLVEALNSDTDFIFVQINGPPDHGVIP